MPNSVVPKRRNTGLIDLTKVEIPITRNPVSPERAEAIRRAVQGASTMPSATGGSRLAQPSDAEAFLEFLQDPAIHAPIYTLPRPLTLASLGDFIADHLEQRERGEGLLFLNFTEDDRLSGYTDLIIWPQWAAGELGGAVRSDLQGQRRGVEGAKTGFNWMFEVLQLDLICETAAPDNIRSARLLGGLGFKRKGEVTSHRPDGGTRASLVWEINREDWGNVVWRDKTKAH